MTSDLLHQLEKKVAHAIEVIELLRMQVEELEEENLLLKTEQDKWRNDLSSLLKRFDRIESPAQSNTDRVRRVSAEEELEEECMTV